MPTPLVSTFFHQDHEFGMLLLNTRNPTKMTSARPMVEKNHEIEKKAPVMQLALSGVHRYWCERRFLVQISGMETIYQRCFLSERGCISCYYDIIYFSSYAFKLIIFFLFTWLMIIIVILFFESNQLALLTCKIPRESCYCITTKVAAPQIKAISCLSFQFRLKVDLSANFHDATPIFSVYQTEHNPIINKLIPSLQCIVKCPAMYT